MKTLLLNQKFEPVKVVHWTTAMQLLVTGRAMVVEEYDDVTINSVSSSWKLPSVMAYVGKAVSRKRKTTFSRFAIFYRDKWTCQYCGTKKSAKELTFDHVLPKKHGGKTEWTNIATACIPCNRKKADKLLHESGMKLMKKPVKLTEELPIMIRLSKNDPEEWRNYVYWNSELAHD